MKDLSPLRVSPSQSARRAIRGILARMGITAEASIPVERPLQPAACLKNFPRHGSLDGRSGAPHDVGLARVRIWVAVWGQSAC